MAPADSFPVTLGWGVAYAFSLAVLYGFTRLTQRGGKSPGTGKDGRASTSKWQVILWTYAIGFALFALLGGWIVEQIVTEAWGDKDWADDVEAALGQGHADLVEKLDPTYLLLLGIPSIAAVSAKFITQTKVATGDDPKHPKGNADPATVKELVSDDKDDPDLGDSQYLLFNVLAVLYFLAMFLPHPAWGLPELPDALVMLTGVSAGTYVAKKGIYRSPPVLFGVLPPAASPGDTVTVTGEGFGAPAQPGTTVRAAATVMFGSAAADAVVSASDETLEVTVPRRLTAGPVSVRVIRPPGAESESLPFEILDAAPAIVSVVPSEVIANQSLPVTVSGSGFLPAGATEPTTSNAVTVDGATATATGWTAGRVSVQLPALDAGEHKLIVYDAQGRPSAEATVKAKATGAV